MSRKVYVDVVVSLIIDQEDGVETSEVIQELDYDFTDSTGKAEVVSTEIKDYTVTDSK